MSGVNRVLLMTRNQSIFIIIDFLYHQECLFT